MAGRRKGERCGKARCTGILDYLIIMPRCACAAKAYGSLLVFLSFCLSVTGIAAQRVQFKC